MLEHRGSTYYMEGPILEYMRALAAAYPSKTLERPPPSIVCKTLEYAAHFQITMSADDVNTMWYRIGKVNLDCRVEDYLKALVVSTPGYWHLPKDGIAPTILVKVLEYSALLGVSTCDEMMKDLTRKYLEIVEASPPAE